LLPLAACSENQASKFDTATLAPSSLPRFTVPTSGATGVSPLPDIQIIYEDALEFGSVKADSVQLFDLGPALDESNPVGVTLTSAAEGKGLIIRPVSQLTAPRTFELRVRGRTTGVRLFDGTLLDDFAFQFTTAPDPSLTAASPLPDAQDGVFYTQSLAAVGGSGALRFAVSRGTLPEGLRLIDGVIRGTPSTPTGTFEFEVSVTDVLGRLSTKTYELTVDP
jgi:hypothetical protein